MLIDIFSRYIDEYVHFVAKTVWSVVVSLCWKGVVAISAVSFRIPPVSFPVSKLMEPKLKPIFQHFDRSWQLAKSIYHWFQHSSA